MSCCFSILGHQFRCAPLTALERQRLKTRCRVPVFPGVTLDVCSTAPSATSIVSEPNTVTQVSNRAVESTKAEGLPYTAQMVQPMLEYRKAIGTFLEAFNQATLVRAQAARKTQEVLDQFTSYYNQAKQNKTPCTLNRDDVYFNFVVVQQNLSIPDVCSNGEVAQHILDQSASNNYVLLLEDLTQIREALGKLSSSQRASDTMDSLRLQQLMQSANQLDMMVNTLQNLGFDTSKTFFQNIK